MQFEEFDFHPTLIEGLTAMGFENPTPIQEQAIPLILKGRDLIACAQTGTGKTAAFLLPILNYLSAVKTAKPQTRILIVVPTRELALQIDNQVEGLGYFTGASSIAVYGGGSGDSFEQQRKAITQGADIIVATPGRFIAHINLGYVNLKDIAFFVLDEADRMLDMGFNEDITKIAKLLPEKRQTLLFSATMPPKIRKLAEQLLHKPETITISISKPAEGVLQAAYMVYDAQKIPLITALLKGKEQYSSVIIFSSTKKAVSEIANHLRRNGFKTGAVSSDLEQAEREEMLQKFANRKIQILVATDVLSRGIDIKNINLVINYDVPHDAEDYVHRVGRTARAETTGVAITLINDRDQQKFQSIEHLIEREIYKSPLPEGFDSGPVYDPSKRPPTDPNRRPPARRPHPNRPGQKDGNKPQKSNNNRPPQNKQPNDRKK